MSADLRTATLARAASSAAPRGRTARRGCSALRAGRARALRRAGLPDHARRGLEVHQRGAARARAFELVPRHASSGVTRGSGRSRSPCATGHRAGVRQRPLCARAVARSARCRAASTSAASRRPSPSAPERFEAMLGRARRRAAQRASPRSTPRSATEGAFVDLAAGRVRRRSRSICCSSPRTPMRRRVAPAQRDRAPGAGSQATVVESYVGAGRRGATSPTRSPRSWSTRARPSTTTKLQQESRAAFHVADIRAEQERGQPLHLARPSRWAALLVAQRRRHAARRRKAAKCTLNGLYMADGRQHVDNHTRDRPRAAALHQPRALQGRARRRGARRLQRQGDRAPDAQKTDAQQTNQNLLLSRRRRGRHQAAAGDLRRRREVHPRRHGRPARRRRALLPALARHRRRGGARAARPTPSPARSSTRVSCEPLRARAGATAARPAASSRLKELL